MPAPIHPNPWPGRWQRFSSTSLRAFHAYAHWLIGISWRRFLLLSLLLMVMSGVLQSLPPFSWGWTRTVAGPVDASPPDAPAASAASAAQPAASGASGKPATSKPLPGVHIEKPVGKAEGVEITIDERGVRIVPKPKAASGARLAASAPTSPTSPTPPTPPAPPSTPVPAATPGAAAAPAAGASHTARAAADIAQLRIQLPPGADTPAVREAVEAAREQIAEALRDAQQDAAEALRDAQDDATAARADAEAARAEAEAARAEAEAARAEAERARKARKPRTERVSLGDHLPPLAFLWIMASAVIKVTYKRQVQAEAQAAQAVETAEAESLRRQVLEARMAAMQAQVEPHFLFNTLASIDHLIEVDPPRASQMQKNLIALLRASMPSLREADGSAPRDLGRELAVIRPYLEILKVRMEERLATEISVPEGLLSAGFPAMMVQTLVENAVKHGLEPKPDGGRLQVRAEVVHGQLAVTVSDTGLGFGRAATAGTGVGLANIRERLQLLYGQRATLTISETPGGGTTVTIAVPYKPLTTPHRPAATA